MADATQDSNPLSEEGSSESHFTNIFSGPWAKLAYWFAIALSVGHIYAALSADLSEIMRNALHFAGFGFLCAITYPLLRSKVSMWLDLALGLALIWAAMHLVFGENAIYDRGVRLITADWIAGAIVILGGMELARRSSGWIIPILIVIALSYIAVWGQHIPGIFRFGGLSYETVMFRSIYGDDAIFGTIARISSTYVVLFIIFGAFLLRSGAGDFVIDLARAVAGKLIGGPGMVAVIASALTGTISGSAVANTASTGVITIPLMKRAGFKPTFAGGVEAASSTGGQLMPPIMGAGAFVMASYTNISYETIVLVAFLPAMLYFASVMFFVRIEAKKIDMQPMSNDGLSLGETVKKGGASFIIPISIVIGMLVSGFSPTYAASVGIVAVVASSWLTRSPMGPKAILDALALGAKNMIMTAVLLCIVGLIVNVIATAGVGNTFSLMISNWADGNVLIAIILIALASLVLGMGLPVTAAYIVLATLSAPALTGMISDGVVIDLIAAGNLVEEAKAMFMLVSPEALTALTAPMTTADATALYGGLPIELQAAVRDMAVPAAVQVTALLSAHMIIFWLSQDSNVTPPVCLAAFTAAAAAKAPPMATGFASWKLAKGLYIVPILFAYTPILSGEWTDAVRVFVFAFVGIYGLAAAMQGWMEAKLSIVFRVLAGVTGLAAMWPAGLAVNAAGAVAVIVLLVLNVRASRQQIA